MSLRDTWGGAGRGQSPLALITPGGVEGGESRLYHLVMVMEQGPMAPVT